MNKADSKQQQFLNVIDRDLAERLFHEAIKLEPLGMESISLHASLGRVLARDLGAPVDVPSFDRSNFDGFAVRAADTYGADEESPKVLDLNEEIIATAVVPTVPVQKNQATPIATGGMIPRGADAIVMIEHTEVNAESLLVHKPVTPGFGVSFAGTDIAQGEIVLRQGIVLTSRETGVLAAIGIGEVPVWKKPVVAIISTGDELIPPGKEMKPGFVFDSNARILADAVTELGGEPLELGIVNDDLTQMQSLFDLAMAKSDIVVLSGGTSKGAGDLSYRIVSRLKDPGIVAHGVALKPGKPICLACSQGIPIVILPGFPTSAVFTFHEFVAPVIRSLVGHRSFAHRENHVQAQMATKVNSEVGRTEYLLVGLVENETETEGEKPFSAFPMGKGSGSVTTFSHADGFVTIDRQTEMVDAQQVVDVQLIGKGHPAADLIVIGSHCIGLDFLLGRMESDGFRTKFLAVGSTAGLHAARRGECDIAGVHLLDPQSGEYNRPFLTDELELLPGYQRNQGILYRQNDARFASLSLDAFGDWIRVESDLMMVNRNQGSGTRILIDRLLDGNQPEGYAIQAKNHSAVAGAIMQGRADWGVGIETVAKQHQLGFIPLQYEHFDFVVHRNRTNRPAIQRFGQLLNSEDVKSALRDLGFHLERA